MSSSNRITFNRPLRAVESDGNVAVAEPGSAALEEARAVAFEEGRRTGAESVKAEREALASVAERLRQREEELLADLRNVIPDLVLACVEQVIPEWQPEAETVEKIVRSMLEEIGTDTENLRVHLCPRDVKLLESAVGALEKTYPGLACIEDEALRPGECYVRGRFGMADGRLAAKLENLKNVMR